MDFPTSVAEPTCVGMRPTYLASFREGGGRETEAPTFEPTSKNVKCCHDKS